MEKGDFIHINYIGRLESGEIFDLTYEDIAKKEGIYNPKVKYKPVPVLVGAGFVINGLDDALLEMNVGEKKDVAVNSENGFGKRDPKLIRIFPRKMFDRPVPGLVVSMSGMVGRIQSVSAGRIRVDFNNPLAGKNLKYELNVVDKIDGAEKQVSALCEFFGSDGAKITAENNVVTIESKLPPHLKERVSKLIRKYVKINERPVEKVRMVEEFAD